MNVRCALCSRPDRAAIDEALAGGESPASVAGRLSLPVAAARKHVERHLSGEHKDRRRKVVGIGGAPPAAPSRPSKPSPLIAEGLPRTREERVLHCMALMAGGRWVRGETAPDLAAAWGVNPGTLEHISGEASRRVKSHTDGEVVRAQLAVALDEGISLGLKWARAGDSRALGALAQLVRSFKELAVPASRGDGGDAPARFVVELSTPERPCPPGSSDPTPAGPGTGSPGSSPGS